MSYKSQEKAGGAYFRLLEVVMVKTSRRNSEKSAASMIIAVDNHWGTLRFVQENMDKFVKNIIMVRKMEENDRKKVEVNARIFERNLEPLFTLISQTAQSNVLDKLSCSLKKALILMAMGRYSDNKDSICKALGISRDKLDKEIALCGLGHNRKTA
jgi:DNA-binding protein Fis